jgi:hypothetical protein
MPCAIDNLALHPTGTVPRLPPPELRQNGDEMRLHFLTALHGRGIKGALNSDPRRLTIKDHRRERGGNRCRNCHEHGVEQPEPESVPYDPHSPGVGSRHRKAISPRVQLRMVSCQPEKKIAGVRIDVLDVAALSAMEGEILPMANILPKLDLGARPDKLPVFWHNLDRTLCSTSTRMDAGSIE